MVHRCGNVGKLTRIADEISRPTFSINYPRRNTDAPFLVLGGFADFLTTSTFANAHGAITGLANLAPVSSVLYWDIRPKRIHLLCYSSTQP